MASNKCAIIECPCTVWYGSEHHLCHGHELQRLARERKGPKKPPGRPSKYPKFCANHPDKPALARGLCSACYQKMKRGTLVTRETKEEA